MCKLLKWTGIEWDEGTLLLSMRLIVGPGVGGVQGPYRQVGKDKRFSDL